MTPLRVSYQASTQGAALSNRATAIEGAARDLYAALILSELNQLEWLAPKVDALRDAFEVVASGGGNRENE